MQNFRGQRIFKENTPCHCCGTTIGPSFPQKIGYVQQGAGGGLFCSFACAEKAYSEVVKANPDFATRKEGIFKGS